MKGHDVARFNSHSIAPIAGIDGAAIASAGDLILIPVIASASVSFGVA